MFSSLTYPVTYDVVNDFAPIAMLTVAPMAFFGRAGLPADNVKELAAWLKANPGKATFGSVGLGGPARVWAAHFQNTIGTTMQFVPYRGAFAAVQDMLGGQIDLVGVGSLQRPVASDRRQDQGLCDPVEQALGGGARRADHRGNRRGRRCRCRSGMASGRRRARRRR